MAITRGYGGSHFISSPQTGIIFTAYPSPTIGWTIIFAVALQSATATVTAASDAAGNTYTKLAAAHDVAGGISLEVWACHVLSAASVYVTFSFSASVLCSVTLQIYVGVSSIWNVSALTTGNDQHPTSDLIQLQDGGNLIVGCAAIFSQLYDVIGSYCGSYQCATSVQIYAGATSSIFDNTYKYIKKMSVAARYTPAARPWMMFAVELRTGVKLYESQAQLIG